MNMNHIFKASAIGLLALTVSACGDDNKKSTASIDGRAALGALLEANCTATSLSGTVLGTGSTDASVLPVPRTDASGNFSATLSPKPSGPYMVSCSGGQYFDEATGQFVTFTGTMKAIVPSDSTSFAITPLTDVAAAAVLMLGGSVTDGEVSAVLADIASFFGVSDILALPQVVNSLDDLDALSGDAGAYAAVLAALAELEAAAGGDAQDILSHLSLDILDGDLGDQFTQAQIDAAAADIAAGTDAADELAAGQDEDGRNSGTIVGSGGA